MLLSSSRFSSNNITGICYVYNTRHLYCSTHAVTSEKIACYLLVWLCSLFFFFLIRGLRTLLLSCVCTISNWLLIRHGKTDGLGQVRGGSIGLRVKWVMSQKRVILSGLKTGLDQSVCGSGWVGLG